MQTGRQPNAKNQQQTAVSDTKNVTEDVFAGAKDYVESRIFQQLHTRVQHELIMYYGCEAMDQNLG